MTTGKGKTPASILALQTPCNGIQRFFARREDLEDGQQTPVGGSEAKVVVVFVLQFKRADPLSTGCAMEVRDTSWLHVWMREYHFRGSGPVS